MDPSTFFAYPDSVAQQAAGFLASLYDDEIAGILGFTQTRRYTPGDLAVQRGDTGRDLYIVTAGHFDVLVSGPRGPQRASQFGPGDIFGELAFFDGQPRSADVRANGPAEALVMTSAGFERMRLAQPRLAMIFVLDLGRILSLRFREHNRRLAALGQL